MNCPNCSKPLERTTYEDVQVMQCGECSGYLVARQRLTLIKGTRKQTPDALRNEAHTEQAPDTDERIRCPKCRIREMTKDRIRTGDEDFFVLDVCPKCDNVWLDGGELAKLQLKFEQSARAVEAFARQERFQSLSDEQRTEFQHRLAELPTGESPFTAAFADLGTLIVVVILLSVTLVSLFIWSRFVSALFSLAFCGSLFYVVILRLEATGRQRLVSLAVICALEAAFLAALWLY